MLKKPTIETVNQCKAFAGLGERLLIDLFTIKYPSNINVEEVEIKIKMLNTFYRTQITKTRLEAEMIVSKDIDLKLYMGDLSAVIDISRVDWVTGANSYSRDNYSFATKYCSFHRPDAYPMYDAYIGNILKRYNDEYSFTNHHFTDDSLKNYISFANVIDDFKDFFHLSRCSLKNIDMFLWQTSKKMS